MDPGIYDRLDIALDAKKRSYVGSWSSSCDVIVEVSSDF